MAPPITDGQRGAAVSAPSVPRWEVADLFRLSGEAYRRDHLVPPSPQKVMRAIEACRTAPLGGHAAHCPTCGCERYADNSCRHRHGPQCQTLTKGQWLEDRKTERVPVPYVHTVFTLPPALNLVVLHNQRTLRTMVCKAASETLRPCGRRTLGGQLGCTMVLHTWDQTLGAHFHVHGVMPAGALAPDGERWSAADPRLLFPVRALSMVLRGQFLNALMQACTTGAFTFTGTIAALGTPQGFATLHEQLRSKDWVVSTKKPFGGPAQGLDDVSRSTHRVALSNNRISEVGDGGVRFTSRNRHQGDRVQSMTLDAHACIRRFLLHIVPSGLMRIRHGGFLANRCKAHALRQCRQRLGQSPDPPPRALRSVAEWMRQLTGIDITQCPHCGYGPLVQSPLPPLTGLSPHCRTSQEVPPCDSSCSSTWRSGVISAGGTHGPTRAQGGAACPQCPALLTRWAITPYAPVLEHVGGCVLLSSHLQHPLSRRLRCLTRSAPRDTIPIQIRRPVLQRLSSTAFYPSWGTTMDKTLFVRWLTVI